MKTLGRSHTKPESKPVADVVRKERSDIQGGKLMEIGHLTTLDSDGTKTEYPFALLIAFKNADDCRRALADELCRFDIFG